MKITKRGILVAGIASIAMFGFDIFLHGGLLAAIYGRGDFRYELPLLVAYWNVPCGLLAYFGFSLLLVVVFSKFKANDQLESFKFGLIIGSIVWAAYIFGWSYLDLTSIGLYAVWYIGQVTEIGIGAMIVHKTEAQKRLLPALKTSAIIFVVCTVVTLTLQYSGIAQVILN
jgi:hypothetical protein